jgi:hypothetical protein
MKLNVIVTVFFKFVTYFISTIRFVVGYVVCEFEINGVESVLQTEKYIYQLMKRMVFQNSCSFS